MTEIWIASANEKKREELRGILARGGGGIVLRLLSELAAPPLLVETGPTFAANAAIKAVGVARAAGSPALGDDSGLCVDALDGEPGVHSARFGGEGLDDAGRVRKLLERMAGVPPARKTARFVCSLCLAGPGGEILAAVEESCRGIILDAPRGSGGFGYDSVFLHPESGRTFAEMTAQEKSLVSHRGKALAALSAALERLGLGSRPHGAGQ